MESVQLPAWVAVIIALLSAIGGLSGVAALINARSKASNSRVNNLCSIIDHQRIRIEDLEHALTQVRAELAKWKAKYFELCEWVRSVGLEPFEGQE